MRLAGGGEIKMRGWSKMSDFEKIFVYLLVASYPYTLHPFVYLLKGQFTKDLRLKPGFLDPSPLRPDKIIESH